MLKTIEQKLRDQERQAIINADQESARSLQKFVKKTLPRTPDELKEQEIMKPYAKYTLDNKYLNFEKSIQQAYNMIDQALPFDGFNNVISAYNELSNYLVSIVKYNSLNQSMKVPTTNILRDWCFFTPVFRYYYCIQSIQHLFYLCY